MNPNLSVITAAIVDIARFAVVAYGIHCTRDFLNHWLDKMPRRCPTAIEAGLDEARRLGIVEQV